MPCPECIFVATLHDELFKLWNYLHNTYCWCHFWSNLGIFDPRGPYIGLPPHCFAINLEEIPSCFALNIFLWLLCITKWTKLVSYCHIEYLYLGSFLVNYPPIIPIFGVIFGQNCGIWPPRCPYIGSPLLVCNNFE